MQELVASLRRQLRALRLPSRTIGEIAGVDPKTVRNLLGGADPRPATYDALVAALPALEARAAQRSAA